MGGQAAGYAAADAVQVGLNVFTDPDYRDTFAFHW